MRARLESDQRLAVFCSQQGEKGTAVRVLKRVRVMQEEVQGVEQALAGQQEEEKECA